MTNPFTVRKYRDKWIFRSPFTDDLIAEGETGDAIYLVSRNDDRYVGGGETVGNITVKGAIKEDHVPALAVGHTRPRMVEDDTLPDIDLSGYWMVIIHDTDYSRGHAHITARAHNAYSSAFDIASATEDIIETTRMAAIESVPEEDRDKIAGTTLVAAPTEHIQKELKDD